MKIICPQNHCSPENKFKNRIDTIIKQGSFYRLSDRKKVQRFCCKLCRTYFSVATFSKNYRQNKRHLNQTIARLLVAGVSQREAARVLKINRKTIVRKFKFMGAHAEIKLSQFNQKLPQAQAIQFDDMETFEHTKCKPLSITLAVEEKTRRILGFEVSQMPAKGLLAAISRKKYGIRADLRSYGRKRLFKKIKPFISLRASIKSDENPHYPRDVKRFFPGSVYKTYKGRRGAIVGQGELKKVGFDPIFDLNHTCAMLRAKASRLFRRTWCTTKKPEMLKCHLYLVALHHNKELKLLSS